mgnify:CR=1 FL=1
MVNKQTIIFAWALPVQKDTHISHIILVIITARIQKNKVYIFIQGTP